MGLLAAISKRLGQALVLLFIMSLIGFIGIHSVGNPVFNIVNMETATAEDIRNATVALGLDQPVWRQYLIFVQSLLTGSFGTSYIYHQPAFALVMSKLPATFELASVAMLIAAPTGVLLGLLAGRRHGSFLDRLILRTNVFALSIPAFWLSMMLILGGAVLTGWLPSGGRGDTFTLLGLEWSFLTRNGLLHLVLPSLALAIPNIALIARLARAGTVEVESLDFIRFCRAKGLSARRILFRHTLPNISIPIVTVIGLQFGAMLAFAVVIETVFAWPGVGKLLIDSIQLLDRPVVMATLTFVSVTFVLLNALVDLFHAVLDPRVRHSS
ncbi:peptide/nickel transport system permease protein [Ochrobactrum intermedium]|uniref:Peptide/nickel transport system permease protein n=1 Tax=Brucella intermedia TaxID=94625 RepID=A0ABR6AVN0_9HYPH|nr:ABC transporter permease [Brucella intermedia]KAB2705204.1 ABC transporter permease [Brucella intermedia]MBA8853525.1 peptide/nickel transport system permease protein [Brucella intermedia]MPR64744.1 ABC transporter permease subunit [Brucella intermedia]